jgi:hypothetical protein
MNLGRGQTAKGVPTQRAGATPKPQGNVGRGVAQSEEQKRLLIQQKKQEILIAKQRQQQNLQQQSQQAQSQQIERGKKQEALAKNDLSSIDPNIKFVDHTMWTNKDGGVIPTIIFNVCKKEIFTPKQGLKLLEKKLKSEFNVIV